MGPKPAMKRTFNFALSCMASPVRGMKAPIPMAPIRVQTCLEPDHAIEILRGALSLAPWRTGKPERTQSGNVCRSGPLSRAVQTKLLRALDTRKFEPLALNRLNRVNLAGL